MSEVIWEKIDVSQHRRKIGEPCASIGYGKIALNSDACDLLGAENIEWVEIMKGYGDKRRFDKIAILPVKEKTKTSFKLTKRVRQNVIQPGADINSKKLVKELFGENGVSTIKRYKVKLEKDKDNNNMLVIDLSIQI